MWRNILAGCCWAAVRHRVTEGCTGCLLPLRRGSAAGVLRIVAGCVLGVVLQGAVTGFSRRLWLAEGTGFGVAGAVATCWVPFPGPANQSD